MQSIILPHLLKFDESGRRIGGGAFLSWHHFIIVRNSFHDYLGFILQYHRTPKLQAYWAFFWKVVINVSPVRLTK